LPCVVIARTLASEIVDLRFYGELGGDLS